MRELALRIQGYPSDLNPLGTVFGGWIMSMMDRAASIACNNIISSVAVTVGVSDLHFKSPVQSGDIITVYTSIKKIGTTSISIYVEVEVECHKPSCDERCKNSVTDATFTFVAISKDGAPIPVRSVLRHKLNEDVTQQCNQKEETTLTDSL